MYFYLVKWRHRQQILTFQPVPLWVQTFLRSFCSRCLRTSWLPLREIIAMSEVGSFTGITGSGCNKKQIYIQPKSKRQRKEETVFSLSGLLTCLVKTILPSRKGGTRLWTSRWTLVALSSSKSSSTSNLCTTPLVSMRLVSHRSLSWRKKHTDSSKDNEDQHWCMCSHDKYTYKLPT